MKYKATDISGVFVIEASPFSDNRGSFARLFCENELSPVLGNRRIVQINHSVTQRTGSVRGMHFQYPPHAEMKIIRCLKGRVFDVAVDLRKNSKTFLKWHAQELSPDNNLALVVPEGCAHGFQALEPASELLYLHTAFYEKNTEGGVRCNDPILAIQWPQPITDISEKDKTHELLSNEFTGIEL